MSSVPCRVMIDLSAHEYATRHAEQDTFDETDEMKVGAIVPADLLKPVMDLLAVGAAMHRTKREHFTEEEREKFFQVVKEDLDKLYKACLSRWRDL